VVVVGNAHAPISEVIRVGGLDGHPQLVDVNTGSVSHRIESLPWVLRAKVFRDWPSSVRIVIVDRVPVAAVAIAGSRGASSGAAAGRAGATGTAAGAGPTGAGTGAGGTGTAAGAGPTGAGTGAGGTGTTTGAGATGTTGGAGVTGTTASVAGAGGTSAGGSKPPQTEYALVDRSGRVLARVAGRPHGLLVLSGVGQPGAPGSVIGWRAASVLAVAAALPASLIADLRSIETLKGDAADVTLTLANGVTALFGPASDMRAKFVALATVLQRVSLAGIGTVDLRVPSAPVLAPAAAS
jgi:cell division septal protein FtsQ